MCLHFAAVAMAQRRLHRSVLAVLHVCRSWFASLPCAFFIPRLAARSARARRGRPLDHHPATNGCCMHHCACSRCVVIVVAVAVGQRRYDTHWETTHSVNHIISKQLSYKCVLARHLWDIGIRSQPVSSLRRGATRLATLVQCAFVCCARGRCHRWPRRRSRRRALMASRCASWRPLSRSPARRTMRPPALRHRCSATASCGL